MSVSPLARVARPAADRMSLDSEYIPHDPLPPATDVPGAFSNAQPVQHLIVLSIVSFGLYPTYWMYENLRALKLHKQLSISPGWRTFGAFIPLIGMLFFKDQLQLFAESAAADGVRVDFSPWGRTLAFTAASLLGELPTPWWIVATSAALVLVPVQRALNAYWAVEQPGLPIRRRLSAGESALLIVCGLVWVLILAAALVGDRLVIARG